MKRFQTVLGLSSFLAVAGAILMAPTISSAETVDRTYVACNQFGECWRVHQRYAYGEVAPITYYNSDWYDTHQNDEHVRWLADPTDDRGYYDRDGRWHDERGARALEGAAAGAGVGAAIGCIVTLPIGCAPGAAVGAAVGGGTGAAVGASTPPPH